MTITTPPSPETVRLESRLRPEQVSAALADVVAFEAEIADRVTTYQAVVEKKIVGVETSAANQTIATQALLLRVLASLYGSAGQLNPVYWERANALKAESADLLDDLTGSSEDVVASGGGAATLSTSPYTIDADGLLVVNV